MKINELEELLGVSRATIRYYEDQGLVTPPRTENSYRDYGDEEARLFQKIIVLRKLGVGVPEIKDLIEDKAELHDVLEQNVDRLRAQQDEIAAAIEMCGELDAEAGDFDSIDPPKYLKSIYEAEENGKRFAVAKEISPRDLNLAITLIGAMAGIAIPQNNRYSKHANSPIPADIRANKKEGDEYYTIGDMLRKGSKRKVFAIAAIALLAGFLLIHAVAFWGGLGFTVKSGFDNKKACIIPIRPNKSELAELITIDPEAAEVDLDWDGMFRFHTQGGLVLTLKHSEDGSWTDVYTEEIRVKEGILFVTGDPSSEIVFHIICDGKGQKFSTKSNDSTYLNKEDNSYPCILEQAPLNKETTLYLYYTDDEAYETLNNYLPEDILKLDCPDGCYVVTVQDVQ